MLRYLLRAFAAAAANSHPQTSFGSLPLVTGNPFFSEHDEKAERSFVRITFAACGFNPLELLGFFVFWARPLT